MRRHRDQPCSGFPLCQNLGHSWGADPGGGSVANRPAAAWPARGLFRKELGDLPRPCIQGAPRVWLCSLLHPVLARGPAGALLSPWWLFPVHFLCQFTQFHPVFPGSCTTSASLTSLPGCHRSWALALICWLMFCQFYGISGGKGRNCSAQWVTLAQ